jgi:two-component system, chemotaxis family, protein-glutamate methylesterase/glutaminase
MDKKVYRVLVVDDSRFICRRLREILEEEHEFEVLAIAGNGQEAIHLTKTLKPDVITMDVAMPLMDGITAVKEIMRQCPTPIMMFSSSTSVGAQATLDALNAGAVDFLPKQLHELDGDQEVAKRVLRSRVRSVAQQAARFAYQQPAKLQAKEKPVRYKQRSPDLLIIAASTGGPVAIQKILPQLTGNCSFPILLVQHMPPNFTASFAGRLNQKCAITVREAKHGDALQPGLALLCPGGKQMLLDNHYGHYQLELRDKHSQEIYSPCIDYTFASIAQNMRGHVLAIVLTGMGADGKEGAVELKKHDSEIWAQDEFSSTIYGMPKAVTDAGLADHVFDLDEIAIELSRLV